MMQGFRCLDKINTEKKIIMGNHDIEDGSNDNCKNIIHQLTRLNPNNYSIKFPFDHEIYGTLLILYIDTTIYTKTIANNLCYNKILIKDKDKIKCEQTKYIAQVLLDNCQDDRIKHIIICGHEPLITYKFKKDKDKERIKEKSSSIPQLLDDIFDQVKKYKDIPFTYLCADYHVYQYSNICKLYEGSQLKIDQIILGTGGGKLDMLVPNDKSKTRTNEDYTLTILDNEVDNKDIYTLNGISKYGYGELIYENNKLKHTFIPIPDDNSSQDYKKYLKYKNKYLILKKSYKNNYLK